MSNNTEITLSDDQDNALKEFISFLCNPKEQVFVLEGYSGTGKSTLIDTLMQRLKNYMQTMHLINPHMPEYEVALTATTNKAAETFAEITGQTVCTIHSYLGLRISKDYKTGNSELVPKKGFVKPYQQLVFIDEASYIDSKLLGLIFEQTIQCKIVFIGDRAQLSPVKCTNTPVFQAGFKGAMLTKVMRQMVNGVPQTNPITDLATQFRETVNTGVWTPFKPDGQYVVHLPRGDFEDAILAEFVRDDWKYRDSKILGWTNKCVIAFNNAVSDHVKGNPDFKVGDYAVCNSYVTTGSHKLSTDQLVHITSISDEVEEYGVKGKNYILDHNCVFFYPNSMEEKKIRFNLAKAQNDWTAMRTIEDSWIDLRAAYAQTINKAQGSTYDRVYIDLADVGRCNSGDQIARMLYVAVSRARKQVFMTGDFG